MSEIPLYMVNATATGQEERWDHVLRPAAGILQGYRGTSPIRNSTPPWDQYRALGIVLLQGPRGALFFMSEVPL